MKISSPLPGFIFETLYPVDEVPKGYKLCLGQRLKIKDYPQVATMLLPAYSKNTGKLFKLPNLGRNFLIKTGE